MTTKTCAGCSTEKSLDDFALLRSSRDGRQPRCRDCRRAYREANKERIAAKKAADYRANPEPAKERSRRRYAQNRESIRARAPSEEEREASRERARAWYRQNTSRHRATSEKWRRENPHRRIEVEQNRRARAGGYWDEDVERLEVFRRYDGLCGICGDPVGIDEFEVDHIVPTSRGGRHSYANTQPAHPPCNQGKRNRLMSEYRKVRRRGESGSE